MFLATLDLKSCYQIEHAPHVKNISTHQSLGMNACRNLATKLSTLLPKQENVLLALTIITQIQTTLTTKNAYKMLVAVTKL